MKRIIIVLLIVFMLAACQPTPETDAVRQKNQDAMLELARGEGTDTVENQNVPEADPDLPALDYHTMYGIPEHLDLEFSGLSDKVKIVVDADVTVPEQPMPIVRTVPTDFSQEQVYDFWQRLVGDRKLFIRDEKETKESIKSQIERCMEILDGPEKNDYEPGEIEQRLEDLKARFNDAPDGEAPKEADGTLITGEMRDNRGRVVAHRTELQAYDPVDIYGGIRFNVQNNYDLQETIQESDGAICVMKNASFSYEIGERMNEQYVIDYDNPHFSLRADDPIPAEAAERVQTTPAEIRKRVDDVLEQMGLAGTFAVSEIGLYPGVDPWTRELNGYYEYRVALARLVNGVPTCPNGVNMNLYWPEDMTAPDWIYEDFEIWLSDDWIRVHWYAPIETQEVLEPSCRLLPFSEIRSILESRLPMLLERKASNEDVKTCTATVRRINLGLWRIREKNSIETGLLVPVYCFYMDLASEHEYDGRAWTERSTDALLINAVDGTVIDPWNGY
jgi:hypothetical protein